MFILYKMGISRVKQYYIPICNMAPNGNQTVNGFDLAIIRLFYFPIILITVDFIQMTFMRGSLAKNR